MRRTHEDHRAAASHLYGLRLDLLGKLNTLSMDFFNKATIGELLMRVNGDTGALYRCLSLGFSDLIKEPVSIISILIMLFALNWKLTLLALIFMVFLYSQPAGLTLYWTVQNLLTILQTKLTKSKDEPVVAPAPVVPPKKRKP